MTYPLGSLGQAPPPPPPGAAPGAGVVPGPLPGTIYVPGIGMQEIKDWTDTIVYDTENIVTPVPAGVTYRFFRNLNFPAPIAGPKQLRYTNMVSPQQLPNQWRAIVYGIHFAVVCEETGVAGVFTTPDDVQRIMTMGYAEFITGNQKIEKEGPLTTYPSPFGLTGVIATTGPAAREWSYINNGQAAVGALPPSKIIVDLINELTFFATVQFETAMVLDANTMLMCILRAFVSKPVR